MILMDWSQLLDAFNSDYGYLERAYESLNGGLNDIYIALNSISFIKLKTVKKNQVSDENAQNSVKGIEIRVRKKKIKSLIENTFEFTPQEALEWNNRCVSFYENFSYYNS